MSPKFSVPPETVKSAPLPPVAIDAEPSKTSVPPETTTEPAATEPESVCVPAPVIVSEEIEEAIVPDAELAAAFGAYAPGAFPRFHIDFTFRDGEVLSLAGLAVRVIATPGHTAGGACFIAGDRLFTGDFLSALVLLFQFLKRSKFFLLCR